jgi:uncharacterized membrane protein YdjX (TVP38/TMEM64 family)
MSTKTTTALRVGLEDVATEAAAYSSWMVSDLIPTGAFDSLRETIMSVAQEGGPPLMIMVVALTDTLPLIPTQPISIVAGALFGLKVGLPAVILGQVIATLIAFNVGRLALGGKDSKFGALLGSEGDTSSNKLSRVFEELTSGLNSEDFKTVFLTVFLARQSPILPFSLGNYFMGAASKAPLLPVLAGNIFGCLPLNAVWVGAGAGGMAAVEMVQSNGVMAQGLETVGAIVTLAMVGFVIKTISKVYGDDENGTTVSQEK